MNFLLRRIELVFLALFAVGAGAVWIYQIFWAMPVQKCEQHGNWWDPKSRSCAHVIYIPALTHRAPGAKAPAVAASSKTQP